MAKEKNLGKTAEAVLPKSKKEKAVDLGKLGSVHNAIRIQEMSKKLVNNRLLNDVHLEDGTTYLLTDEALESQWIKPPKEA